MQHQQKNVNIVTFTYILDIVDLPPPDNVGAIIDVPSWISTLIRTLL
jgi:hypothetical protein